MRNQIGRASDSARGSRHLSCNAMDMMIMMCNMYQWVSLDTRTAAATSLGYLFLYLLSLVVTTHVLVLCGCSHRAMCCVHSAASPSPLRGHWACLLWASVCTRFTVRSYYRRTLHIEQSCETTMSCKAEKSGSQQTTEPTRRRQKTKCQGYNSVVDMWLPILDALHALGSTIKRMKFWCC